MKTGDSFIHNAITFIVVGFEDRGRRVIGVNPNPKTAEPIKVIVNKNKVTLNEPKHETKTTTIPKRRT